MGKKHGQRRHERRAGLNHVVTMSALALALGYTGLQPQQAAAQEWTGAGFGDWFDGANWNTGSVPTIADSVTVDAGAASGPMISGAVFGPNAQSDILTIGADNIGRLELRSGLRNLVTVDRAVIGLNAGSEGLVRVDGYEVFWRTLDLVLGSEGTGLLEILDGGSVEVTRDLTLGQLDLAGRGHGTLRIAGRDLLADIASELTVDRTLDVGLSGTGRIEILDGGVLRSNGAYLGWGATGDGHVLVDAGEDHPGSVWNNSGELEIGGSGTGELAIGRGAMVNNGNVRIGARAGSGGTVVLTALDETIAPAITWIVNGNLTVGDEGQGTLLAGRGRILGVDGSMRIGESAGSQGEVRLSGAGTALLTSDSGMVVGVEGVGELWINQGARLNVGDGSGRLILAELPGSTGLLVIGALASTPPGVLEVGSVEFGDGDSTLRLVHGDSNYQLDATLSGSGLIQVLAGTTRYTGDGSLFNGAVQIETGRLVVNSTLNGAVTVGNLGTLAGNGTVGALNVNGGGTVAPGNSIGTINVAGDVIFAPGSVYAVEINAAGDSDRIHVTGTATLNGGTVQVIPFPDFAVGTAYTILIADGGLLGAGFDGATLEAGSVFVTPQLSYDANNVFLVITQITDFDELALTRNQRAAARGIQSVGAGPVFGAIALLAEPAQARHAFDAISGEVHASLATALLEDSRFPREATLRRLADSDSADGRGAWVQVLGSEGRWRGDGNAARLSRDLNGVVLGFDGELGESGVRAGLVGGYTDASYRTRTRGSRADSENWHLGAYAGGELTNGTTLRGGVVHGWHRLDVTRHVAFGEFHSRTSADYDVRSLQTFGEVSWALDAGGVTLEPLLGLAHVRVRGGRYAESGDAAALKGKQRSTDASFVTASVRAASPWNDRVHLNAMLGARHMIGKTPKATHRFAGGTDFVVAGTPIARNVALLDLGIHARVTPAADLGVFYSSQLGSGHRDHALRAALSMRF